MYRTILFDLDGTITDPKEGITKSVQYALGKFGIATESLDSLVKFIGPPLKQSFIDFYSFSESQANDAISYYREYFSTKGKFENKVYPGIPKLLSELREGNLSMSIATSKPTVFAEDIIEYFKLSQYFETIVGSNLDNTRVEKAEVISHLLAKIEHNKNKTIMIGDRVHDIIGANINQISSVGVLYGYGNRQEFAPENPTFIVNKVSDILSVIID